MAKFRPGGQKTARRAAKRPPTGKLKLSRVISGYGGLMISPSLQGPFFGQKFARKSDVLLYIHITHITGLNGIISPPLPEVTLDNFGFPVGGRLAARRAVFRPPGRILALFGRYRLLGECTLNFGPRSTKLVDHQGHQKNDPH